jgi:hypothetical protein
MLQLAGHLDWIEHGSGDLQLLAAAMTAGNIKGENPLEQTSPAARTHLYQIHSMKWSVDIQPRDTKKQIQISTELYQPIKL